MKSKLWILSFIMAMVFLMVGANSALASTVYMQDLNTKVTVDSDDGMISWRINNGGNQIKQQWFWFKVDDEVYKLGDDGPAGAPVVQVVGNDTGFNPGIDSVDMKYSYTGMGLDITIKYDLAGTPFPSDYSDMAEVILLSNTQPDDENGSPINIQFYQYNDWDLVASPSNDDVRISSDGYAAIQWEESMAVAEVTRTSDGASGAEMDEAQTLLAKILSGVGLADESGTMETTLDDAAWAFQWDFNIAPQDSKIISKDKHVVTPIPSALLLFGSGIAGLFGVGIRRRKS